MLDLDKNWVDDRATKKSGTSEVKKYVMSLVRYTELERILNKKSFKNAKIALDNAHISIDVMNCKDEIFYLKSRKNDYCAMLNLENGKFVLKKGSTVASRVSEKFKSFKTVIKRRKNAGKSI